MKSLTKILLFSLLLILAGFTAVTSISNKTEEPKLEAEKGDNINVVDEDITVINYVDKGKMTASWYGPRFNGKLTANGETYNQEVLTAAHKTYRFGTLLRVTNPANMKSVIVRINDRGPFVSGRHIDLSKAAAREIELIKKGVARVKVEQITLKGVNFPVISFN